MSNKRKAKFIKDSSVIVVLSEESMFDNEEINKSVELYENGTYLMLTEKEAKHVAKILWKEYGD